LRLLYVASDQIVPGRTGGSVHVLEVARGLARRGHEVHVVVSARGQGAVDAPGVTWHRVSWQPPLRFCRFRARPAVAAIAERVQPQAVMERYYNFGGEGILTATARGVPSVLEVNSPVVDHPGSWKGFLDGLAVVRPMRRYRERLCREASALVSPLPEIVPAFAREKTETVTWGANVEAFSPERRRESRRRQWGVPSGARVVLFSGSFRPWHGVHVLEDAARRLADRQDIFFVLVGGPRAGRARGYAGLHLGAIPYDEMPEVAASCDIGVAPYDTRQLRQLELGFFWSPLKIFEYMASGLPTVTLARRPLTEIVREEQEALHIPDGDGAALAAAIARLASDTALRREMGRRARARVEKLYSWDKHCETLEAVLQRVAS
jgi:glycosyltransferase involved in cell wall biosynthesis